MTILNDSELKNLEEVTRQIELKTSAEVRLMIVKSSSEGTHVVPFLWSLLIAVMGLIYWIESAHFEENAGLWLWPATIAISWAVAVGLAKIPGVARRLSFNLDAQVWRRAELEFYREGLTATAGATGVLVFLSLLERQAVVLGDKAIVAKLPKETWDKMVEIILNGARSGQWAAKLEEALRHCGELLQKSFPIQPGDQNELANHVIVN